VSDGVGSTDELPWLVVGLGNPGPTYAGNRHNVGVMVVDVLAARLGERWSARRARAELVQARLAPVAGVPGPRLVLAKPMSFMNLSGGPVGELARFFRTPPAQVLVVHDDLDLPYGTLRLKRGGGEGGHNGLRSVTQVLGTRDYSRLRVGIGRPPGRMDPADFVLRDFSTAERRDLELLIDDAADAVESVLRVGWDRAQNGVNTQASRG